MKIVLPFFFALALLTGCQSSSTKETPTDADTTTATDATEVDPDTTGQVPGAPAGWAGTYAGQLPCADCEGIQTELTLSATGEYTLRRTYLGKANQQPVREQGTWKASDGNAGVVLDDAKPDKRTEYRFTDGNTLKLVGRDGKELDSTLNYSLTKQ